jgi:adenosylcobinamide-GDP ribazoletransferase
LSLLAAFQFLTAIPLPLRQEASPQELGRSVGYFPVVGLCLGAVLLGLDRLLGLELPSVTVDVLLVIALALLTGALHLDGLVDTCDAIAGRRTLEERWRVMRDSRAGSFGAIGVCCLLLLKYASLSGVPEGSRFAALLLMPVAGRWAMAYALFAYPYARSDGLGRVFKEHSGWRSFLMATAVAVAVAIGFARLCGVVTLLAVWVGVVAMAAYLRRKFAGLTGDTYGAINEVTEVLVLIVITLVAGNRWLTTTLPW